MCEVARLWPARPRRAARAGRRRFLYVLVDEYQDTNRAQLELLRLLARRPQRTCASSATTTRPSTAGAAPTCATSSTSSSTSRGARVIKLEQNYRSRGADPRRGQRRHREAHRREVAQGALHRRARAGDDGAQSRWRRRPRSRRRWVRSRECARLVREEGVRPREVAVLYRSNAQSQAHRGGAARAGRRPPRRRRRAVLRAQGGEGRPRLPEARAQPGRRDQPPAHRELSAARHRRDQRSSSSRSHAATRGWSLWQSGRARRRHRRPAGCGTRRVPRARAGRRAGARASSSARSAPRARWRGPSCERVALSAEIDASAPSPDRGGQAVGERRGPARDARPARSARRRRGTDGLAAFLQVLTMDIETEGDDAEDVVTLSTLHGSKGLEFDVVFLIGCEEGLPAARAHHRRARDGRVADARSGGHRGGAAPLLRRRHPRPRAARSSRARSRASCAARPCRARRADFSSTSRPSSSTPHDIKDEAPTSAHEAAANVEAILAMLAR